MKKLSLIVVIVLPIALMIFNVGCATQRQNMADRSGAQLWGENCVRCHSIPSPAAYNDVDWETIGMHMRIRAGLTEEEIVKIVAFMQSAN